MSNIINFPIQKRQDALSSSSTPTDFSNFKSVIKAKLLHPSCSHLSAAQRQAILEEALKDYAAKFGGE